MVIPVRISLSHVGLCDILQEFRTNTFNLVFHLLFSFTEALLLDSLEEEHDVLGFYSPKAMKRFLREAAV